MTDIPPVPVTTARRSLLDRVSVVWLVPLAALIIALGIAWQAWVDRGPVIEILFEDAAGVSRGVTELRFRNVTVGMVEEVRFTDDLDRVVVAVRVSPQVAPFIDASAQFWVVRPEVNASGITGLETVLSGVFLEGHWDTNPGDTVYLHEGLPTAPLLRADEPGLRLRLWTTAGVLTTQVPLIYKGVPVGRIGPADVAPDGSAVVAEAVIDAPYDNLVTEATRFWDASGFSISIGSGGAAVNFDSIASLIVGGITFDTFVSGAALAQDGSEFEVFYDEASARASIFNRPEGTTVNLTAIFAGDITGLALGSPVELDGLRIGEVSGINGVIDPTAFGDDNVRLQTVLSVQPVRMGLPDDVSESEALDWLEAQVAEGLRARLATGSILSGGLKVQLFTVADAAPATLDRDTRPYPELPTVAPDITDVAATAQGALSRIESLPIEQLIDSAIGFLDNASMLVGSAEVQAVPGEVAALIGDVRAVVGDPGIQAVPGQIATLLAEVEGTVTDLRALIAEVEAQDAIGRLLSTVDSIAATATTAEAALEGLPGVIDQIQIISARIAALPLDQIASDAGNLLASLEGLIDTPEIRALPAEVNGAVAELRGLLTDLREGPLLSDAEATAAAARTAAEAIATAAANAETAIAGLPALVDQVTALATRAADLPLEDLVTQATGLLTSVDALVASDAVAALPADLSAALADLRLILTDIREAGVIETANATMLSAQDAVDQIATAAEALPAMIDQINVLLNSAATAIAGVGETSTVVRDAREAMREITRAAEAVAQLARTIERNPNALIFGR
jgi:paraquat-inducible protein B